MPKFNVTTTQTVTTNFPATEIEADTQDEAETMMQEMIEEGTLSSDSEDFSYEHKTTEGEASAE